MLDKLLSSGQTDIQMIIFKLGNEEYAVPITEVQEIIMVQEPTRIPKSPKFVEGVINLRGNIIPIVDGKRKFLIESDNTQSENDSRIMILELEEETIGLIVDAVSEVIHLQTSEIEPPPIDMGTDSDFLWGVGKHHGRLLILLDPQKFLNVTETTDLKGLTTMTESIKQLDSAKDVKSITPIEVTSAKTTKVEKKDI